MDERNKERQICRQDFLYNCGEAGTHKYNSDSELREKRRKLQGHMQFNKVKGIKV